MAEISIVIAMYNIAPYIGRCLSSIKAQTFEDYEVYIVNDGSKDDSPSIAEGFCDDHRFHLVNKENGGLSSARNHALDHYVKTPYVLFVDGDDFLEPDLLEKALGKIKEDGTDLLVFSYRQYYLETQTSEIIHLNVPEGVYDKENKSLIYETSNAAWNKIYKTKLFDGIRYPLGKRYEDLGTTPKLLLRAGSVSYLDLPLYDYLVDRPNNITSQVDEKMYHLFDVMEDVIAFYKQEGAFEEYRKELFILFFRNMVTGLRKVINLTDKKFVFRFIDDVEDFRKKHFIDLDRKDAMQAKDDKVYLFPVLCKSYYLYRKLRKKYA